MTPRLTRAMGHLLGVGQQLFETDEILLGDHGGAAQLALTLRRLLGKDVSPLRLAALEPVRRLAKTFCRGPVGLQLGHRTTPDLDGPSRPGLATRVRGRKTAGTVLTSF